MNFNKGKIDLSKKSYTADDVEKKQERNKDFRKKMLLFGGIILGIIVLIFVILFVISLFSGGKKNYQEVEEIMSKAAVAYMKDHKGRLPKDAQDVATINVDYLINGEYMKPLEEYLGENSRCSGYVEVIVNEDDYKYTAYLDCKSGYVTTELYKKIADSKIVETGYGLYKIGEQYVYRGEDVKNYLQLGDELYRIVKVKENNDIMIIRNDALADSDTWDNRYNIDRGYKSGINDYRKSRIYDLIKKVLKSEELKIGKDAKANLVKSNFCLGKRYSNSELNDNSLECTDILKDQIVGLLTASDYLTASIDENCKKTVDRACQNYNYLKIDRPWWLLTATPGNSYFVFRVADNGVVEAINASSRAYVRPVFHIRSEALYKSGKGTLEDPYKIR